jgi:hypothetical protein
MDKQEAMKELARLVSVFENALGAAEHFATEHKLEFSISPTYGMGGWFKGDGDEGYGEAGWNPSSQSC